MAAATQNKRKRDAHDQPGRANPTVNTASNEFDQNYLETGEEALTNADGVIDLAAASGHHGKDGASAGDAQQSSTQRTGAVGGSSTTDTAAAAMAQYHTMTVPQSTEQAFMERDDDGSADKEDDMVDDPSRDPRLRNVRFPNFAEFLSNRDSPEGESSEQRESRRQQQLDVLLGRNKPSVGSDEWHKQRRDNHKEVERRRRETINEGITELSKIVPGCEKNKGSILQRAVQFITQLKENESQNIEKWTLEKLLTEQAIAELSASCDKLKAECQRAWAECEQWKKAAQKAGVSALDPDDKSGDANGEEAE